MPANEAQQALVGWKAAGPRIVDATFKTDKKKMKVIHTMHHQ